MELPYTIQAVNTRKVKKFKTTSTDYTLKVKPFEVDGLSKVLPVLTSLFESVLANITKGMAPKDQVRFVMNSPKQLDYAISLPFMPLSELTTHRILAEVQRVLQSHQEFTLDGTVTINIIHVEMPVGSGKTYGGIKLKDRLQKKGCFVQVQNKDELCCARAIVTAVARVEKDQKYMDYRKGRPIQRTMALDLHHRAGVPLAQCGIQEIKRFQEVLPEYQLVLVSAEHFNAIIYKGPDGGKPLYLYLHDGHYDVISSMPAFLNRSYFCLTCQKGYNTENGRDHRCATKCACCHQPNCTEESHWVRCEDCLRMFKNHSCYGNHKQKKGARSVCETYTKCTKCGTVLDKSRRSPDLHRCGEVRCHVCDKYVDEEHRCYMQPIDKAAFHSGKEEGEPSTKKRKKEEQRYIFFDFECTQETGVHVPNLVVAQDTDDGEHVFRGPNTAVQFCDWLFNGENDGAICIAHNLKGYDSYFILSYLYDNKILPSLILNGSKVMEVYVSQAHIKFIDSLNFLAMPLSAFPKAFGFTELVKGYFPHFFNTQANEDYMGPIPDARYYDPDSMKEEARDKFFTWYTEQRKKGVVFDLQAELLKYCRSDVDILRRCSLQFRQEIINECDIDPFEHSITIASACNTIFRKKFLKENTIGIIPHLGYKPHAKQSVLAYQWLTYLAESNNIYIQHGRNAGEKHVGPYRVDGYNPQSNTVYEFHGCFFHGCVTCYPRDTVNPLNQRTMAELYESTQARKRYIEQQGYRVVEMWECNFRKDQEAQTFVNSLKAFQEPLEPRDSFYGGRTNATKLLVNTDGTTKKIKYVDFTSLYPWVNKNGMYPLGHPVILTENLTTDIAGYFGLVKCDVLPPHGLYHPVLPYRSGGKLMFPLCRVCAETCQQEPCQHNDGERTLTGTWVSLEIKKALEKGYQVIQVHEVWHFAESTTTLFKGYVDTFLKKKQEASGWPGWCVNEENKKQYIREYEEKEGIKLDPAAIAYNEGKRTVYKNIMNNFWGKLGQRPNKPKVSIISDPAEYFDMLTSGGVNVTNVHLVNEEIIELFYSMDDYFVETNCRTNVVLAAFTTAQARLKLYDVMEKLNDRICYYDTDSVIYTVDEGEWEPPLGDYLGELTNELDEGEHINTFVSAGPKNYAYCTSMGKTVCKVRGITLNFRASQKVNLTSMVELVKKNDGSTITVHNPHRIVRNTKTKTIETISQDKDYKLVYDKRVIQADYDTLPYGY